MMCLDSIHDGCYAKTVKKSFLISRRAVEEEGSDVGTQRLVRDTSDGRLGERARRTTVIDKFRCRMAPKETL